jgi:hypothetical protein
VTRQLSETEIRVALARVANMPPDDVAGYILVLTDEQDVTKTVTNAATPAHAVAALARAIEYAATELAGETETGTIGP